MNLEGKYGGEAKYSLDPAVNVTPPQPECSQDLCSEPSTPAKTEGQSLESRAPPKHLHKSPEGERVFYFFIQ